MPGLAPAPTPRIVIFDDSSDAIERYGRVFAEVGCDYLTSRQPAINDDFRAALLAFRPDLVIVDLVMGEGRRDGYRLIAEIRDVAFLDGVPPIIVGSKLITHSPMGAAEKAAAESEPGVVAAFGKFPELPTAAQFLAHARQPPTK